MKLQITWFVKKVRSSKYITNVIIRSFMPHINTTQGNVYEFLCVIYLERYITDHSCNLYAKYSEKRTFLTPDTHVINVCIS